MGTTFTNGCVCWMFVLLLWRERQKGDYDILCDDGVYEFVGEFLM